MLFDTHAHLDDPQLSENVVAVLEEAANHDVRRILTVSTNLASCYRSIKLAQQHTPIYAAVGIHPNSCHEASPAQWKEVETLVEKDKVVAIGETGLDDHWDFCPSAIQQEYFARHIQLSHRTDLPFIVHMRDCEEKMMDFLAKSLNEAGRLNGVMHSFCGSADAAKQCLQWGMHISFAGMVTYKKNDSLRTIAAEIPDDRLLIETDAPYLSPHPCRSTRPNQPALVRHTLQCLAETRGVDAETLAETTSKNALTFFGINA